jgi:hypothetical protein
LGKIEPESGKIEPE